MTGIPVLISLDTLPGYGVFTSFMKEEAKKKTLERLSRIEGQVRGIARMIEGERYCIDIITQISAVQAALRKVESELLRNHVSHCVEHAIQSGDADDQRKKIAELIEVLERRHAI